MKHATIFLTLNLCFIHMGYGQQDGIFGIVENYASNYNPAFSGLRYDHHGVVGYRNQWVDIYGAPHQFIVNDNHLLFDQHGVGLNYNYESIAHMEVQSVNLNYNYQLTFGSDKKNDHRLSIGISPGLYHYRFRPDWINPIYFDPIIIAPPNEGTEFDLGIGIAYKWKGLFVGQSIKHVQDYFRTNSSSYNLSVHYYFYGGYNVEAGSRKFLEFTPQLFLATDWVGFSATVQIMAAYSIKGRQRLWVGIGFRTDDVIQLMGGIDIAKRFRLGYSYEFSVNKLSSFSLGSHEAVLGYYLLRERE